jgi:spermidine synthase
LICEVCWIRRSSLVFGSSTLATSTVVAVFFLGLAIGSWVAGWLSGRSARPMRAYGWIEVAIAALALASPAAFGAVERLYVQAHRAHAGPPETLLLVRAALVALVLLPPTVLMGATLPLVSAHVTRRASRIAASVGALYAWNTAGAAIGCALAGLALIPAVGTDAAIRLAALANLAAAALASRMPAPEAPQEPSRPAPPAGSRAVAVVLLFFLTGFVALAYEVLWTRFLGLLTRNTVFTYTISLTVVLTGIVIGSALASRLFDGRVPHARWFGALQVLSGLYVLALMLLPPALWQSWARAPAARFLLFLPPSILSGAAFPLAVRMVLDQVSRAGLEVGRMSAANIMGGIAGSLAAGFAGLPVLGLQRSVLAATGLSVAAGIAAWLAFAPRARAGRELALGAAAALLWLAIPAALRTRVPNDFLRAEGALVEVREGLTSNAAVIRSQGTLQLQIDRWWQGQDRKTHQIMAAHVPLALHPDPRAVLVVGVGSGQTASRFLMDGIERLDCVDIEPVVFDLVRSHFDAGWLRDPRVRLLREDGRNLIARTPDRYDIIALEVGQVFRPGVASFYTADFYQRARQRLRPGGLVCQFVPLHFLDVPLLRSVVATFLDAFPNSVLWYNTAELLLIGSPDRPATIRDARLRALLSDPRIRADLAYSQWGGRPHWLNQRHAFLAGMLCGSRGLAALSAGAPRLRDDRPVLEYAAAEIEESAPAELPALALVERHLERVGVVLADSASVELETRAAALRARNLGDVRAGAALRRVPALQARGDLDAVEAAIASALRHNPESRIAHRMMGDVLVSLRRFPEARAHYDTALAMDGEDALALRGLGDWHAFQGRIAEAAALYRRALGVLPDDAESHNNLGVCLAQGGDLAAALSQFRAALRLQPDYADARRNLDRGLSARGVGDAGR